MIWFAADSAMNWPEALVSTAGILAGAFALWVFFR